MAESRLSGIFEELKDIIECGLCLDICKDPRMLPCCHWFCTNCIQQLIDTSDWPSKFTCPSCRMEIPRPALGATHFPAAFIINKLDEAVRRRKEAQPKTQAMCSRHKKPLDAYCVTCKQTLCITCVLTHDGHEKLMISEMQQKIKKPIEETTKMMRKQLNDCETRLSEVGKAKLESLSIGEVKKRNLKDHGKKIMDKLQQSINNMEQQIDDTISKTIHEYENIETSLKSEMSDRAEAILHMESALTEEGSSEIIDLELYKILMKNLDLGHPLPQMKIDLKLPDITKFTDELLVGMVTGSMEDATSKPQAFAKIVSGLNIKKIHQFDLPCQPNGVACDQEGNIAVCGRNTVHIFTQEGRKLSEITPPGSLWDIAATKGRWYITENFTEYGKLFIYDKKGQRINTVYVGHKGEGGVAVSDSHLYITSEEENAVYRLDLPDASNRKVFIKNSLFKKYLDCPRFVATNGKHVVVSSHYSHQVSVFDMSGARKFVYGGKGTKLEQLKNPMGVAIFWEGRVLVADWGNDRVSIVSPQGHHLIDFVLADGYDLRGLALTGSGQIVVACKGYGGKNNCVMIYQYA
eukprot:GHVU01087050.1.p1 GENE.GHVU01087050.1~~GHVU01087050.1.p1  ORF type:complete len:577 (-),score=60.21 GHVU01087050.1:345-2075(-)